MKLEAYYYTYYIDIKTYKFWQMCTLNWNKLDFNNKEFVEYKEQPYQNEILSVGDSKWAQSEKNINVTISAPPFIRSRKMCDHE